MSANEIVDKAKIGITREQLEDELGEPVADVTTQAGQGVELLEFEARDKQLVAVTIEGGRVSAVRLLGVDGEAQDQPPAAPTTSSPAAP